MRLQHKFYSFAACLAVTAILAAPSQAATPTAGVVTDVANMRDSAGYTKVIKKLAKDAKVSIVGEKNGWYQIVTASGYKGWVIKDLIKSATAPQVAAKPVPATTATPQAGQPAKLSYASKVRKTPEIKAGNVIQTLYPGVAVTITGMKAGWYAVQYGAGKSGWIAKDLVALVPSTRKAAASAVTDAVAVKAASANYPTFASSEEINQYWLDQVNALRKAKGLRQLKAGRPLIETATEWANYLGSIGNITHVRTNGQTAMQWANERKVPFAQRNTPNGWRDNYFTENLGLRMNVQPTLASVKSALDGVLQSYLNEGAAGVHYRTTYHPDWNSVGASWYPVKASNGTYTIYFVFHYGSLAQ